MKILVLGGGGMLGHKVVQRLASSTRDLWWTLRTGTEDPCLAPVPVLRGAHALPNLDLSDTDRLSALLRESRPDVVVNCLGVIKQRAAATDLVPSVTINSFVPHLVTMVLQEWGARLIQVSTDCVFSGTRGSYVETDSPDANDLYGQTKAAGEVLLGNAVTLRTSIIGRELKHHQSLLDWFLAQRGRRIRGYRRAFWSGVTTNHLAKVIESLIYNHPELRGLYHLSSGTTSKESLLGLLRNAYRLDVEIDPDDGVVCDRSLIGARFEEAAGYRCPPLATLIEDLVSDPTPYPILS